MKNEEIEINSKDEVNGKDIEVTYIATRNLMSNKKSEYYFTIRFECNNAVLEYSNKEGILISGVFCYFLFKEHSIDMCDVIEKLELTEKLEYTGILKNVNYIEYDDVKELGIDCYDSNRFNLYIGDIYLNLSIKEEYRKKFIEKIKTFISKCSF